jgi:23S rRNA (cytosine1962-C5)-methyltransferase
MELRKDFLLTKLVEILRADGQTISGIFERNDESLREKEGLLEGKGWYPLPGEEFPASPVTEITENGIKYLTWMYVNGQKTGFFLDQKYNRLAVAKLAKGRRVLDCFTHTGSFGLNCRREAGAAKVTSVDISAEAQWRWPAKRSAGLNGLDVEYVREHFRPAPRMAEEKRRNYDLIILDPPAFTKSRATLKGAERGYKEINMTAP